MSTRQPRHTRPRHNRARDRDGRPAEVAAGITAPAEGEDDLSGPGGTPGHALTGPDAAGWPVHAQERRDFYHRIRAFPPEVNAWRQRMLRHILANPLRFPLAVPADPEQTRGRLDDGIVYLREVARILALLHGTPDLGNKPDPTDELVYILL